MHRKTVAAGRFYPGTGTELQAALTRLGKNTWGGELQEATAVVVPHAGYIYSGPTAFKVLSRVRIPSTVILIGPNHHGLGARVAVGTMDWQMPWGTIPLYAKLCHALVRPAKLFQADDLAHAHEHALEVQLPLLNHFRPDVRIVPIATAPLTYAECERAALELAEVLHEEQESALLLASTDMSHYKSRCQASRLDRQAIEQMVRFNPRGLYQVVREKNISMCGMAATVITLLTSRHLGAKSVELVEYTDSGEATGDLSQVVGYAGLVVS
ncbi:MAG: AmmeMemoRadiSam system protein B [Desulfobulbus propionicus]|nr:MAG: AmmeMemoRadiSam system protein B [Desulfobulbus propionicus]